MTPAEYAVWLARDLEKIFFTDVALTSARQDFALARRQLRIDALMPSTA